MSQPTTHRERQARWLLVVATVLGLWAAAIAVTGGFRIELGSVRISSRNAVRVFLLALIPATLAWRLAYQERLDQWLTQWRPRLRRISTVLVLLIAAMLLIVGVRYGVRAAAAADVSGYLSQSALWLSGDLRIDQSFAGTLEWPHAKSSFAPLAYGIAGDEVMVPTPAPGLPLLMAAGRLLSPCAPYVISPICGALLVLFTFQLGRHVFGVASSVVAAALVACSPVVVFMALTPMADVPAAAFWTGALAMGVSASARGAALSGLLAGIAILVRPNLVPLAIFPWLLMMVRVGSGRPRLMHTVLFAAGSIPGALFIAWVNNLLYGSPFASGYGNLDAEFSSQFASTNVRQYATWWWESQGLLAFLFVIALFRWRVPMWRERLVLIAFALVLGLLYLFYRPFNAWWFLRFLLPAVPLVFLFCADAVDWASRGSPNLRVIALTAYLFVTGAYAVRFSDVQDITNTGEANQRYVDAAIYIAEATPRDAVIVTMQHSGSVRYHAGRLTLRWDWIEPEWLDRAVAVLRERGVPIYLLLEYWEDPEFREKFKGQQLVHILDRDPDAVGRNGELRFYRITSATADGPRQPAIMPYRPDRSCLEMSPDYVESAAVRTIRRTASR